MLAGMDASEYVYWQAIYATEPFPEERADLRTAEVIQALMLGRVKQLPNIADLIHDYWGEAKSREQSPAQMKANMDIIKAASKRNKTRK
ncbi:MAG: hypothetical protein IPP74_15605 [Alphaproteobacteria bacterium]|nr:hypothetical protein [Alphaproteobacteria bacterium]